MLIMLPVSAVQEKIVIYSSDFSKDPGFTTNNPSRYYWDVTQEQYHFETEGGTNGYAFLPVELGNDPFTLEYDINVSSIEKDGAVRFGLTSTDMDISKAANILGIFEYGQYGRLMSLQVIDQNNHLYETDSLYSTYCGGQRDCETKLFEENVTYHVEIRYNKQLNQADIKVTEKKSGGLAWGFYIPIGPNLHSLSRLAITTKGDYILDNTAVGYLDNIELYTYREVIPTVETTPPTTVPTTVPTPTPTPTPTKSPVSLHLAWGALVVAAGLLGVYGKNRG
ncbi:MAG: hypothetical protein LUQ12_01970 [Methanoregulaceae archaeon]|jgi:hypothetical protein|nr:hypothetical protein [Methanoregulaceae archaeon]